MHVASGSLDEFIESPIFGIERIAAFHLVELDFFESHPGPKHLLAYESLWSQPALGFAHLTKFPCGDGIALDCFAAALDAARFEAMQSFEIDINKTGRSSDYLRLGIPNWTGDRNALKVRRGGVGRFREARPDLADDALLARKHPLTLEVLRRAPPSS